MLEKTLFFVSILLLPSQLGRHFWPEFSFLFSLPIDYFSPTIYLWDLVVVALLVTFIVRRKKVNRTSLNLFLIFILTQSLSLAAGILGVSGADTGIGLVRLEQLFISGLFAVYLSSQDFKNTIQAIFWPLCTALLFESVLAILEFSQGASIGFWIFGERTFSLSTPAIAKFDFEGVQLLRPYATFSHPNVLAAFIVIASLLLGLAKRNERQNKFFGIALFASTIALIFTVSRTALISAVIGAGYFLKKRAIVGLIALLVALSPFLYTRFAAIGDFDNLSLQRRQELNESGFRIFQSSPFFGVGLNNFIKVNSDQVLVGESRFMQPIHNIFLLTLAETGIVGFFGVISLIGYPIWRLVRATFMPTLFLIWMIIIFLGLFDHYFLTSPQGIRLLFLVWGLTISASNISRN